MRDCRLTSVWSLPDRSSRKGAGRRRELRILSGELAPPFTKLSHGLVDGEGGGGSRLFIDHIRNSQSPISWRMRFITWHGTSEKGLTPVARTRWRLSSRTCRHLRQVNGFFGPFCLTQMWLWWFFRRGRGAEEKARTLLSNDSSCSL